MSDTSIRKNQTENPYIRFNEDRSGLQLTHPEKIPGGTVAAIPSKSCAHRLLIAAALSDIETRILCPATSKDIDATAACMQAMGAKITRTKEGFSLVPISRTNAASPVRLCVGESGSTLRFLLPVLAALGLTAEVSMEGRLPDRPLFPLDRELRSHGITLSPQGQNPLLQSGHLTPGTFTIDGGISSQFITGLLFALPLLSGDSSLEIRGRLESRPYVDITLQVLQEFGIQVTEQISPSEEITTTFRIPGGQTYHPASPVCPVEADWSNAAFFLTAGAILPCQVTVTGCNLNSAQGDKEIVNLLSRFGARFRITRSGAYSDITVSGGDLSGILIDAANIPDLVPILSVAAASAKGTSVIRNIERLRIKESDRVATVLEMLANLGVDAKELTEDHPSVKDLLAGEAVPGRAGVSCIRIVGAGVMPGGSLSSHNDHRIAMAAAIASLRAKGPVKLSQPMAVQKSYPGFYEDLAILFEE